MCTNFKIVLDKVIDYVNDLGFNIIFKDDIDEFFKGDLDGLNIILRHINYEEDLFNILHMVGHSIQWNDSSDLRDFGNVVYNKPDEKLLAKLRNYEWEANCYGYKILTDLGYYNLKNWLELKCTLDMVYLTHFYKTGEKLRGVVNMDNIERLSLNPKELPKIIPKSQDMTRNGIVINFD